MLHGKINMVKTSGLSKLIFNASVFVIPECFIKKIDKKKNNFDFNWDGTGKDKKINYCIG